MENFLKLNEKFDMFAKKNIEEGRKNNFFKSSSLEDQYKEMVLTAFLWDCACTSYDSFQRSLSLFELESFFLDVSDLPIEEILDPFKKSLYKMSEPEEGYFRRDEAEDNLFLPTKKLYNFCENYIDFQQQKQRNEREL